MTIVESGLTIDAVFNAYFDCRKAKRNSINQLRFEVDLEPNLVELYNQIRSGDYKIGRKSEFFRICSPINPLCEQALIPTGQ